MKFAYGVLSLACVAALGLGACSKPADVPRAVVATPAAPSSASLGSTPAPSGIAWRRAASDADVDAAFGQARADAKPVFLYWGAAWCPPCNQVKATLFNRQDFIERSRAFVPVYVDGDSPGAQKLGARFHVSGYPTMLLFSPAGVELTRLPGEVDPARYTEVVTLGMNAKRPVKAVLADALAGAAALAPSDWRLLAFYSWESDEQQLVPRHGISAVLKRLASACPSAEAESATRLWLKALAATDAKPPAAPGSDDAGKLLALLGDEKTARIHFDVLANNSAEITRAATARGTAPRKRLLAAFDRALERFEADATLSRADRLGALVARVDLAKIDAAKRPSSASARAQARAPLAPALLADVRAATARADREITDGYERQAVITAAAYLLAEAGLMDESDALLKANLAKSHSPYYLMTGLAENATKRGDSAKALRWHREAYEKSEGPATRLQWGARYIGALVDLSPRDEAGIERAASTFLAEAGAQPDVFYERSARALRRVSTKLRDWNRTGAHGAALRRFDSQLAAICTRLDAADDQRATCTALLKPAAKKDA
ncbi:MAG TPA: thioredoxin fold domain-containing protein [Caldimonas sp.]